MKVGGKKHASRPPHVELISFILLYLIPLLRSLIIRNIHLTRSRITMVGPLKLSQGLRASTYHTYRQGDGSCQLALTRFCSGTMLAQLADPFHTLALGTSMPQFTRMVFRARRLAQRLWNADLQNRFGNLTCWMALHVRLSKRRMAAEKGSCKCPWHGVATNDITKYQEEMQVRFYPTICNTM